MVVLFISRKCEDPDMSSPDLGLHCLPVFKNQGSKHGLNHQMFFINPEKSDFDS